MLKVPFLVTLALFGRAAFSQTYSVSTFAGGVPVNVPGNLACLSAINGLTADASGNVYLAVAKWSGIPFAGGIVMPGPNPPLTTGGSFSAILRWDTATGTVTSVAGNGAQGFTGDFGPANLAALNGPTAVAIDSTGNLYIADTGNNRIRKVSNGVIATFAGGGSSGLGDGGPAISAVLSFPTGVAVDSAGNVYIADSGNNRIREVVNGTIQTLAGTGSRNGGVDGGDNGPATAAVINNPEFLAVDSGGNIYFSEPTVTPGYGPGQQPVYHNYVRRIANGNITTFVGGAGGGGGFSGDNGPAAAAKLAAPTGVAVDAAGNVYIADGGNYRLRKVSAGVITTVAGNGAPGFGGDGGLAVNAQLFPTGVAVDSRQSVFLADGTRIREITAGTVTTVAGNGQYGVPVIGAPATSSPLEVTQVAVDPSGTLYFVGGGSGLYEISNGIISVSEQNTAYGGPVAADSLGNVYVTAGPRYGSVVVLKISNGVASVVAGGGSSGVGDGGPATSAQLSNPTGIAVDAAGNIYIADAGYVYPQSASAQRIRKVSGGIITTVAGNGMAGFSGDGGPATDAEISGPMGVAVDSAGNVYIADTGNLRVRKVSNGIINTIAGNGIYGAGGDYGVATDAELFPTGLAVGSDGRVYVADQIYGRVRVLTPSGAAVTPSIAAGSNAASNFAGPIAPGEIVVLSGVGLGPVQITSAAPGTGGRFDAAWNGASVSFNSTAFRRPFCTLGPDKLEPSCPMN